MCTFNSRMKWYVNINYLVLCNGELLMTLNVYLYIILYSNALHAVDNFILYKLYVILQSCVIVLNYYFYTAKTIECDSNVNNEARQDCDSSLEIVEAGVNDVSGELIS